MLTKDAIIEKYSNGQIEWYMPIEWHVFGAYRKHGEAIQYYPTGEVKIRVTYEHGVAVGEEKIFSRDGKLISSRSFNDENKEGKKDASKTGREPGPKKILPGDHIPASLR